MEDEFGTEFRKGTKLLSLAMRHDGFLSDDQSAFQTEFMIDLVKRLGSDINVLNTDQLASQSSFDGVYYCDWNDQRVVADSFLTQLCLSKGATLLEHGHLINYKSAAAEARYVALSPYHGMLVKDKVIAPSEKQVARIDAKISSIMKSRTNQRYPWPRWLMEWSQEDAIFR